MSLARSTAALLLLSLVSVPLKAQSLSGADRTRIIEARRLVAGLGERLWPGWKRAPFALLLVTESAEYLIDHPRPGSDFVRAGYDSSLAAHVWQRPRVFAPTLLATFPAVGAIPTIVVGTAEHTGKASTEWVLTLLHEHFHQWQYSIPNYYVRVGDLGLARGDTTGMWMLNYPFPYDSIPVQQAMKHLRQPFPPHLVPLLKRGKSELRRSSKPAASWPIASARRTTGISSFSFGRKVWRDSSSTKALSWQTVWASRRRGSVHSRTMPPTVKPLAAGS